MSSDNSHKIPPSKVYIPSPEDKATVIRLLKANVDAAVVAEILEITQKELLANYPIELRIGSVDMVVEISKAMFEQALDGHFPSQKFMLECLGGWQTKTDKEKLGDKAHPLQVFMYNPEHPDPENLHPDPDAAASSPLADAIMPDPAMDKPTL